MPTLACGLPRSPGFEDAVLGRTLPAGVEDALREAGVERADAPRTMAALMRAQALAPEHPAVLIALYRHHFYGHRLAAARDVVRRALVVGAEALGLPRVWREVARHALPGARHEATTRFYLFALKGYAYLSLRLADAVDARDALALLRALDPEDAVGGALLERVRRCAERSADDDEGDAARETAEADEPHGNDGAAGRPSALRDAAGSRRDGGDDDASDVAAYVQATGAAAWNRAHG